MPASAKKSWVRRRHKVVRFLLGPFFWLMCKIKYGLKFEPLDNRKRPYLVLCNHQTKGDQFFLSLACKAPVYFVATEDIFSNGFSSALIRFLVAPIPFKKSTSDIRAVMDMMQVAREGGTIVIFPEGNRTYCGKTCNIKPSIAHLAQKLKLPVAIMNLRNGYGIQPRWSDHIRKGNVELNIAGIIEPEEYKSMSQDELYRLISTKLSHDESGDRKSFPNKRSAQYLERLFYVCPNCGLTTYKSSKIYLTCQKCGQVLTYNADKTFTSPSGNFPYEHSSQWYEAQEKFIRELDLAPYADIPLYCEEVKVSKVIPSRKKIKLASKATIALYGDRVEFTGCPFDKFMYADVYAMSVLDNHKLNIYIEKDIYQIVGDKRFNALKYVNIFYHATNKGDQHDEFLGL